MSSNPGWVELGVRSTPVLNRTLTKNTIQHQEKNNTTGTISHVVILFCSPEDPLCLTRSLVLYPNAEERDCEKEGGEDDGR